jgi:hypothetical protein
MACFQFRPSTVAAQNAFSILFKKHSASLLALGQYGVILRCLKPKGVVSNSSPLNGGPLASSFRSCGFRGCGGENLDFRVSNCIHQS